MRSAEHPVTAAIAALESPALEVLAFWHARTLAIEPSVTEGISYALPALLYRGKPLIAVAVTKVGYSAYPFSSRAVSVAAAAAPGLTHSKGAVRFTNARPLPREAFDAMLLARRAEIDATEPDA
jgi:uncharacterized protein YdhG (YjbR/CyaY superfamily)